MTKAAETYSLLQIAELAGGRVAGDGEFRIAGVAPLRAALATQLGLLADPRYLPELAESGAGAILVSEALAEHVADDPRPKVIVKSPHLAMLPLLQRLDPTPRYEAGVHPTAVLEAGVVLGAGVSIGAFAVIEAGASIGEGTRIGHHCVVGRRSTIGRDGYLHPHVVIYAGVTIGDRVALHSGCSVGVDGFGYAFGEGRHNKIPQVGRVVIGDDVEVGANTVIDRGSIGNTSVGDGSKLDNLVQVAHNVTVGRHVVMAALSGLAGSTIVEDYVQMAGQSATPGHLTLGKGAILHPRAVPIADVAPGKAVMGFPARDQKEQMRIHAAEGKLPDLIRKVRALEKEVAALKAEPDND